MIYVEYFDSGRIHTVYSSAKPKAILPAAGSAILQADREVNLDLDYVQDDILTAKAESSFAFDVSSIVADRNDTATIEGLHAHTLVTWPDGEITEINDGLLEFAVDLAGTHTFIIDSVAFLKQEVSIEAIATA